MSDYESIFHGANQTTIAIPSLFHSGKWGIFKATGLDDKTSEPVLDHIN